MVADLIVCNAIGTTRIQLIKENNIKKSKMGSKISEEVFPGSKAVVQKKIKLKGYELYSLPNNGTIHISHEVRSAGMNIPTEQYRIFMDIKETENDECWGSRNIDYEQKRFY